MKTFRTKSFLAILKYKKLAQCEQLNAIFQSGKMENLTAHLNDKKCEWCKTVPGIRCGPQTLDSIKSITKLLT